MENIEIFEQYLSGTLSPEETKNFESKLKTDKDFASDFKIYLFTVKGIVQETEQENADFANAMKHLSKDDLLRVIGRRKVPKIFRFGYLRERTAWAAGFAALFIFAVFTVFVTWQHGNRNVDNMLVSYYYFPETKDGQEHLDINMMSVSEVKEFLPVLISDYEHCSADDIQACEDAGMRVALAYLKIHNRKMARQWLVNLMERFADDAPFVAQCQRILDQIK